MGNGQALPQFAEVICYEFLNAGIKTYLGFDQIKNH
jgi:hypothetical protein